MYGGLDLGNHSDNNSDNHSDNEADGQGTHDSAHRKRMAMASKRHFDPDCVNIDCQGRDGLLYVVGRDNARLQKWRSEKGALVYSDWIKGEIVIGGRDDTKREIRDEVHELIDEKEVSEFYVPHVVNMSFLLGHNCKNLKKIEDQTGTFLRPKGSHKSIMICGSERGSRDFAKKMLKELCGDLYPTSCSHLLVNGNVPRSATVVFIDKDYGYLPVTATGRHPKTLVLEERQAFLEDTDENKLSLSSPYGGEQMDGAMQQARPLGTLLQTNSEFIQQCLFYFLNEVRPHKGLITLTASFGKIIFLDLNEDVSSVCWRIEEFAYQSMLFNMSTIFSNRCDTVLENFSDRVGGIIEDSTLVYEFSVIDKRASDKLRNVLVTARYVEGGEEGAGRFEAVSVVNNDNKQKEFTRSGELNPQRPERFSAHMACLDRKVDIQLKLECRPVAPTDSPSIHRFTEGLSRDEEGSLTFEQSGQLVLLSARRVSESTVAVGNVRIKVKGVQRGQISKDHGNIKFERNSVTNIEVSSKVWDGAFTQNLLAASDDSTRMTWSGEQLLCKDLEEFMTVVQTASKYVKPI